MTHGDIDCTVRIRVCMLCERLIQDGRPPVEALIGVSAIPGLPWMLSHGLCTSCEAQQIQKELEAKVEAYRASGPCEVCGSPGDIMLLKDDLKEPGRSLLRKPIVHFCAGCANDLLGHFGPTAHDDGPDDATDPATWPLSGGLS